MVSLEGMYKDLWVAVTENATLMALIGITPYEGVYPPVTEEDIAAWNVFINACKAQIFEGQNSDDALTDTKTKLQITEGQPSISKDRGTLSSFIYIYSWVTKENNRNTRYSLQIADEIIKCLDRKERRKQGLLPIKVGAGELEVYGRDPYARVDARGWDSYGVIFKVSYIT